MTQTAAGEDPLVLRAFRTLSPASQQSLCPELAEVPGPAGLRQAQHPGGDISVAPSARTQLCEAYLRTYVAQAPSRTCRHLTAVMDDTVQGGISNPSDALDQHTAACSSCSAIRAELAVLRSGSQAVLTGLLLDATKNSATARADNPGADSRAPTQAGASDMATTAGPGSPSSGPHPGSWRAAVTHPRASLLVAASIAVVATAIVAVTETTSQSGTTPAPLAHATVAPPMSMPAATTASPTPSPETPAPAADDVPASPSPSHTAPDPVTEDGATSTQSAPLTGFRLVNKSTGLCVGAQSRAAGAGLRLEECREGALQRWETLKDASGAYQLRNTGSDKCLDGTEGGGNIVRAVLNYCGDRSSAHPVVELWTIHLEKESDAFRLHFVPRVPSSDYSSHLFGPEDWWNGNPPHEGSYLAHLPNYYNSESFVFTMNHGE
ncbi:RICIN domain-containing protein [Streptomyces sp. NPDC085929]|uniref:RICIN domain-containing protein n=1 Tax=Streptomyces sp. NPDC085929 TaxID=3365739 RepID=UPI0037D3615A